jgi:hypothetical protein
MSAVQKNVVLEKATKSTEDATASSELTASLEPTASDAEDKTVKGAEATTSAKRMYIRVYNKNNSKTHDPVYFLI